MIYRPYNMPILRPITIPTQGLGFFKRYKNWLFGIRQWEVMEDWTYTLRSGRQIFIPAGYIFNGASIPRIFWGILSPTGILLIPALPHDFAYEYGWVWMIGKDGVKEKFGKGIERKYWDDLFMQMAIRVNGFKVINKIARFGLFIGSKWAWNKHRKNDTDET